MECIRTASPSLTSVSAAGPHCVVKLRLRAIHLMANPESLLYLSTAWDRNYEAMKAMDLEVDVDDEGVASPA